MLASITLAKGSNESSLIQLSSVAYPCDLFNEEFALQVAFSLVLPVCTMNELSDVVNFITPC